MTLVAKEDFSSSSQKMGPLTAKSQASFTVSTAAHPGFSSGFSSRAAKLGMRIHLSSWNDREWSTYLFFCFQVSVGVFSESEE